VALWRRNGEERASEVPRTPIKVGIVGFGDINPTLRSRRVGGRKQQAEQAFMNCADWELGVIGRTAGFWAAWLVRRLEGNTNRWKKKATKEKKRATLEGSVAEMESKTATCARHEKKN
jgi:hypothetical protein